jgi:hypothetical protein
MVGYSLEHPGGTYRMFNPVTNGIHVTRDVTWLRRKFYPDSRVLEAGEGVVMSLENFAPRMPSNTPVADPPASKDEEDEEVKQADDGEVVDQADEEDDVDHADNPNVGATITRSDELHCFLSTLG